MWPEKSSRISILSNSCYLFGYTVGIISSLISFECNIQVQVRLENEYEFDMECTFGLYISSIEKRITPVLNSSLSEIWNVYSIQSIQ